MTHSRAPSYFCFPEKSEQLSRPSSSQSGGWMGGSDNPFDQRRESSSNKFDKILYLIAKVFIGSAEERLAEYQMVAQITDCIRVLNHDADMNFNTFRQLAVAKFNALVKEKKPQAFFEGNIPEMLHQAWSIAGHRPSDSTAEEHKDRRISRSETQIVAAAPASPKPASSTAAPPPEPPQAMIRPALTAQEEDQPLDDDRFPSLNCSIRGRPSSPIRFAGAHSPAHIERAHSPALVERLHTEVQNHEDPPSLLSAQHEDPVKGCCVIL